MTDPVTGNKLDVGYATRCNCPRSRDIMICGIVFMSDVIPAIMEARLFEEISQQILIANPMGWKYEEGDCWDEVSVNYSSCWENPQRTVNHRALRVLLTRREKYKVAKLPFRVII
jgi:hypothetical protein